MAKEKAAEKDSIRVFLVDDHPIVRDGLKTLIERRDDLSVCGEAENASEALKAIRTVLTGEIYVSGDMAKRFLHKMVGGKTQEIQSPIENLSDRELEIFKLIGEGFKASQIAERLYLSVKTIETYRARIKEKLDLADAGELLRYAIKWAKSNQQ